MFSASPTSCPLHPILSPRNQLTNALAFAPPAVTYALTPAHLCSSDVIFAAMVRASVADRDRSDIISAAMASAVSSVASKANSMVFAPPAPHAQIRGVKNRPGCCVFWCLLAFYEMGPKNQQSRGIDKCCLPLSLSCLHSVAPFSCCLLPHPALSLSTLPYPNPSSSILISHSPCPDFPTHHLAPQSAVGK